MIRFKLFDIYTGKWILQNPNDAQSVLSEEINNSLLEKILPPKAIAELSIANIEMGMLESEIANSHPEGKTLLMAKGDRAIYGLPEYKQYLEPYLNLETDYPYHRYLSNENLKTVTTKIKVWVIEDEKGVSGIESVNSARALEILGDSHGKVSLDLASQIGNCDHLLQYRMVGAEIPFFAKGTVQANLASTLKQKDLTGVTELEGIDMILPTSSIKGSSKSNLPPGIHEIEVHLANHEESNYTNFTLRSVLEKLDGNSLAGALKQQVVEIESFNQVFGDSDAMHQAFLKYLEPQLIDDPNNPGQTIPFDPEDWENCGKWEYIAFRKDYESGHHQLINSPLYAQQFHDFYASRARGMAALSFVKVRGGMIGASHDLSNNEICVPYLKEGEKVAAIRSPIIQLPDIALATNKLIDARFNDEGKVVEGMIICSPQLYDKLLNQTRDYFQAQSAILTQAGIDTTSLDKFNPFNRPEFQDRPLASLNPEEKELLIETANVWREYYNDLILKSYTTGQTLDPIRLDTFTSIIKADFDGDAIAILPQSDYPSVYAGIEDRILRRDSYTEKLDKIKLQGSRSLAETLAIKSDPYILGTTANLAESLQSYALDASRLVQLGTEREKQVYLAKIAPVFYYLIGNPTVSEIKQADRAKLRATFRSYTISSTDEKAIHPKLVAKYDALGVQNQLLLAFAGEQLENSMLDKALSLWSETLLDLNLKIAQQNQIAVDNFKSEREVDSDFVSSLSNRFKPLNDRLKQQLEDEETFKSKLPKVLNSTTNRALLVQNVTQNLVSFQAQPSSYSQIQGLFPEVDDGAVLMAALSAVTEYKNLTSAAWHSRKKGQIDKGSSLVFTDKFNRTIEITNLQSYGLTPNSIKDMLAFNNKSLDISIEPNPNSNDPHKFFAFYQDMEGKKQKLGSVCNASVFKYDLKDGETLTSSCNLAQIAFITPAGEYQSKRYTEAADKVVADFRVLAEESGNLDVYAAATYQILTNSNSDRNNLKFMTKAFGAELVARLDALQLNNLTIGSLTNKVKLEKNREVYFDKDPNTPKALGVFVEDTELVQIGQVYQGSFQPRLGTRAIVEIKPNPPATGTFVLGDGSSFQVGKMQESEVKGLVFDDEEIEVEIEQGKSSYTPILKVDGKTIGVIDKKSIAYLQDIGAATKGTKLNLNLTISGSDNARKIKGLTPNGTVFEIINVANYLQDNSLVFDGKEFEVEIDYKTQPATLEAYIYKDGERLKAGEFVYNRRKDIDFVKDRKLVGAEPFKAKLTNKVSTLNIIIDPNSVVYPDRPINRFEQITVAVETAEKNPFTQAILEAQTNYQSMAYWRDRDWYNASTQETQLVSSLDLIVDANKADMVKSVLLASGVEFQQVPGLLCELETRKGFVVFRAVAADINRSLYAEIKQLLQLDVEFDDYVGGNLVAEKYAANLENRFNNLIEVDRSLEAQLLIVPDDSNVDFSVKIPEHPSLALLQLIQLRGILSPQEELQLRQQIDRFDLSWLNFRTDGRFAAKAAEYGQQSLEEALAKEGADVERLQEIYGAAEVYAQDYYLSLLEESDWQELLGGNEKLITEDAELIYQHKINGTDFRYSEELKSVLGESKYQFYSTQVDRIIADQIEFLVARSGSYSSPVTLVSESPQVSLPLPETLFFGQVPGIAVNSKESALALYLSNPQDFTLADTARPIEYEGNRHESIQHAFGAIAQTIPQSSERNKQLYALTKNLLIAKFSQYPEMRSQIEENGGLRWLKSCRCEGEGFWAGAGEESALVRLIIQAHALALKSQLETKPANKNLDPIAQAKSDYPPISKGTNLSSYSQDSLGAALSLTTNLALYKKTIKEPYPVSFRGNPYRKFDLTHKAEKYRRDKQPGVPFESAFDAYRHFGKGLNDIAQKQMLLTEILQARFEQHPQLAEAIALRGGVSWLEKCEVKLFGEEPYLEGKGTNSGFIRATIESYEAVVNKGLVKSQAVVSAVETSSPVTEESEYEAQLGYISQEDDAELKAYIQQKLKSAQALPVVTELKISGKPMQMNFPLKTYGANSLPVDNCFDAMRGYGRTHTTRNFEPHQGYGVKEGDIMLAYKGAKDNPEAQIALRVGKESEITPSLMTDPKYQQSWADKEKHAPQALPEFFSKEISEGKSVWGLDFEPLGDYRDGKIYDFATGLEIDISLEPGIQLAGKMATDISAEPGVQRDLDDVVQADISKSIQYLGQLDAPTQSAILAHLEEMRGELNKDVSQYAQGRQNFWLGTQWDLKDKTFTSSGTWNSQLWELVQRIYPEVGLALITYSGDDQATGINFHRDDSYADFEGRSLSLETIPGQETNWSMKQCYPGMGWVREQNANAQAIDFSLPSGSMVSFNCKNPHAAQPGAGRWSINMWSVSAKLKDAYQTHIAKQGIDGGAKDFGLNSVQIPVPQPMHITPDNRAGLSAPPLAIKPDLVKSAVLPSTPQSGSLGIIGFMSLSVETNLKEAQKNLSSQQHVDIYQKVTTSLAGLSQVKVLDTIRVWEDPNLSSHASNSLVASLVADEETVRYAAARAGLAANQSSVSYFMESKDGTDTMFSFDLKGNLDLQEIKEMLEIRGFDRFTLIPTPTTTKVLILNRNGQHDENIENLIKDYGQPRIYQGTVTILRQSEYEKIGSRYEEIYRSAGGTGIGDRHDERSGQSGHPDQLNGRGQLSRLEARRNSLKSELVVDSVDYKIVSIATSFIGFNQDPSLSFTAKDVVGVSGSTAGVRELPQMKADFQHKIAPALDRAIAVKSTILLENRAGINKLVIQQLKEAGYIFKQTQHGYISAVSTQRSKAVETVAQKLPSFVLPRTESASDRQVNLSTEFLPVAVELLRLIKSNTFENQSYRLNVTRPDLVLIVTEKSSQAVVYKSSFDPKSAVWIPDLDACHLSSDIVDVFNHEVTSIKNSASIPLSTTSSAKPVLVNRNRFAEELNSASRVIATAADFNLANGGR